MAGTKFTTRSKTGKVTKSKPSTSTLKELAKVKASIKKLNMVSYDKVQTVSFYAQNQSLTGPYNVYNVSAGLSSAAPLWGYNAADMVDVNKAYLNKKIINVSVRQNNEPNLIRYTMYVVSLKDAGADSTTFAPATGALTLAASTHYTGLASDMIRVSDRFFNIHATKTFTMGYQGSAGPTADTISERRFKIVVTPKTKMINNPKGNVFANTAFDFPKDPSQNYFVVLFNDNSAADLENNQVDVQTIDEWAIAS